MKFSVILSISKTHLFSRKKQTIVAALGVTFGIGAYIIMMSFMTGLNGLLDGLVLNRTPHVHLFTEEVPSSTQPLDRVQAFSHQQKFVYSVKPKRKRPQIHNALPIMEMLRKNPKVSGVTPQVRAQGFYLAGSIQLNASILGVNVLEEASLYHLNDYIVEGSVLDLVANEKGIIIGKGAAEKLSLSIGDIVQIGTVEGEIFPLKIVGFYQSGLSEVDDVQSYVNLKMAQIIIGESVGYITDVNVKLNDMSEAPIIAKDLGKQFDLASMDIQHANAQFDSGTSIRNMITYAVSITLLIVAGFGIYNILNMLIYEKMNDIAILKATGFSGRDVRLIFISEAVIIGFIGGLIGLVLGYFVSWLISTVPFESEALPTLKTMPVTFKPIFYVVGMVFAMVSTYLAGYLPSRKAERIDPVEIIRGQ